MNSNDTRLLVNCDGKNLLYRFSPSTDKVTYDGRLEGSTGAKLNWEGVKWSKTLPDTLYALDQAGKKLYRVNVAKRGSAGYTLLKDFSSKFPSSVYLTQLSVSDNANVFSFHTRDKYTGKRIDAGVWVRDINRIYVAPRATDKKLDETFIDKDGKYVYLFYGGKLTRRWNFRTGWTRWYTAEDPDENINGHYAVGGDYMANSDAHKTGVVVHQFSEFWPENILRYKRKDGSPNWELSDHFSLNTRDETFVVGSTYGGDGTWAPFEDEIFIAYTDGHGFVRLAHTRSYERSGSYWAEPRASVSMSGKYIVYTSDLGSYSRTDVMILKVPSSI
jgi:hypothetical protein